VSNNFQHNLILFTTVYCCLLLSKTVSARIPNKKHEELRERCNRLGCSINEFVGESVKFMLSNESDFQFEPEDEPSEVEPELKDKRPEPKIFECRDGNLYHDGDLFGKCADYTMKDGKVYDDSGQYLGQTRDSIPKATVTSIE